MQSHIYHQAPVSGVAASTAHIATAGYDNQVILWDAVTHIAVNRVYHDHLVNQCSFSDDGKHLVTASSDYSARVWSIPDMRLEAVITAHSDDVMQARLNCYGDKIATCSYDSSVVITDLRDRSEVRLLGHNGLIERFAWSPDGRKIASCGTDGTIRLWDAQTGAVLSIISDISSDVDDICFLSDDVFIAGADTGDLIKFANGTHETLAAHTAGIKCLSRDKNRLLSIGYDQKFIVWDIDDKLGLEKKSEQKLTPEAWARSACFFADDIIFGSFGSRYLTYGMNDQQWSFRDYKPSTSLNAVTCAAGKIYTIGDAGRLAIDDQATASVPSLCNAIAVADGMVLVGGHNGLLYEALTGRELFAHTSPLNCVEVLEQNAERTNVVLGAYDGAIVLLSFDASGAPLESAIMKIASSAIKGLSIHNGVIFCGSADGSLTFLDYATRAILTKVDHAHDSILNAVSFFNRGFVTVSRDLTMRRWNQDGKALDKIQSRHFKSIKCIASSADGRYSASGSYGGTIDIFDHDADLWVGTLKRPTMSGISSIVWNGAKELFVAASYDGYVYEVPIE